MAYAIKNSLFVRNLSPQVNEATLREVFAECDCIEKITFKPYPNSSLQFFAQIDFRSSKGVADGSKLSGTSILGVPCVCGVIDPIALAAQQQASALASLTAGAVGTIDPEAIQAQYLKQQQEAAEDQRFRTVHVAGLADDTAPEGLRLLCKNFGEVQNMRIDKDGEGHTFALVEFTDRGPATVAKMQRQFLVDGRILAFTEAKTFVDASSFVEQTVQFQAPILDAVNMRHVLLQQGQLSAKLEKVLAAAREILGEPEETAAEPPEVEAPKHKKEKKHKKEGKARMEEKEEQKRDNDSRRHQDGGRNRTRSGSKRPDKKEKRMKDKLRSRSTAHRSDRKRRRENRDKSGEDRKKNREKDAKEDRAASSDGKRRKADGETKEGKDRKEWRELKERKETKVAKEGKDLKGQMERKERTDGEEREVGEEGGDRDGAKVENEGAARGGFEDGALGSTAVPAGAPQPEDDGECSTADSSDDDTIDLESEVEVVANTELLVLGTSASSSSSSSASERGLSPPADRGAAGETGPAESIDIDDAEDARSEALDVEGDLGDLDVQVEWADIKRRPPPSAVRRRSAFHGRAPPLRRMVPPKGAVAMVVG